MFGLFKKSPAVKLKQEHKGLLTKAFEAQRNGDIRQYSLLTAEAEELRKRIVSLEKDAAA